MKELEFHGFPKMGRLNRDIIITEKIDGTNAQILITEDGDIIAGSRTRWITPQDDNHGFAKWVEGNKDTILQLGVGRHFGEWWGSGIQRGYGLSKGEKRLSLFNTVRWCEHGKTPLLVPKADLRVIKYQDVLPEGINTVPILYKGMFNSLAIDNTLDILKITGSYAVEGFMNPEGIVVFHTAGNVGFKVTIKDDEIPKSMSKQ